jgi:hypothetical protein
MVLCDVEVDVETDLAEVWSDIASHSGRRDRDLIEIAFRNTAAELETPDLTPVVTPNLAKKITGLRFVGADLDNLNEGINPFSVVIGDHSTASGEAIYQDAIEVALGYHDLKAGNGKKQKCSDIRNTRAGQSHDQILSYYFGGLIGRTTLHGMAVRQIRGII